MTTTGTTRTDSHRSPTRGAITHDEAEDREPTRKDNSYLVATFANFPGVEIPLLSDEECQARGIDKPAISLLGAT